MPKTFKSFSIDCSSDSATEYSITLGEPYLVDVGWHGTNLSADGQIQLGLTVGGVQRTGSIDVGRSYDLGSTALLYTGQDFFRPTLSRDTTGTFHWGHSQIAGLGFECETVLASRCAWMNDQPATTLQFDNGAVVCDGIRIYNSVGATFNGGYITINAYYATPGDYDFADLTDEGSPLERYFTGITDKPCFISAHGVFGSQFSAIRMSDDGGSSVDAGANYDNTYIDDSGPLYQTGESYIRHCGTTNSSRGKHGIGWIMNAGQALPTVYHGTWSVGGGASAIQVTTHIGVHQVAAVQDAFYVSGFGSGLGGHLLVVP